MNIAEPKTDEFWMRQAMNLAEKGRGYVSPNPLVGCVLVSVDGRKIGEGWHEKFGHEHAEINALRSVHDMSLLSGATMFVTLEPCSHTGKTPPCALEIVKQPIKRVVIGLRDPNPKVDGKGIHLLKERGLDVKVGVLENELRVQNEFFLHYINTSKPFVCMKIAQTLDGYIASHNGTNESVTGKEAQRFVHTLRAHYDGVLVGQHTAYLDNPRLTVREVEGRQPFRIVLDGDFSLPSTHHLFSDQFEHKTIRVTWNAEKLAAKGDPILAMLSGTDFRGQTMLVSKKGGHTNLSETIERLGEMGIASVLVEPGKQLATAMLKENLVDKLHIFVAPKLLGGGTKSVSGLGLETMNEALQLNKMTLQQMGSDYLFTAYL